MTTTDEIEIELRLLTDEKFAPVAEFLGEHVEDLAELWDQGRVAHVAFDLIGSPFPQIQDGMKTIFKMPRKTELRWAEASDAVVMRFVAGKAPRRMVLWWEKGCLLLRLVEGEGWIIEPGSTDAERERGAN